MRGRITDNVNVLRTQIGPSLDAPPRGLSFKGELERAFQAQTAERRRGAFANDALGAILVMHLVAIAVLLTGFVTPAQAYRSYLAIELILTVPSLALVALAGRYPRILNHIDALSVFVALLSLFAGLGINRCLSGPIAVYHAFGLSIFPVKLNLRADLPFKISAPLALVYLPILIANAFQHPGVEPAASWCAAILYLAATGLSLSANYRMEASERRLYLTYRREALRSAEIVEANRKLDALSRTDSLTGLTNRRDFDERFSRASGEAERTGEPLTVLMLDIDHFKLYNDAMGHPEGDKCIRAIAGAVAAATGAPPCFAGRIGGEEFAVVLPGFAVEAAAAAAVRIRAAVENLRLPHPALGERRIVSISIGAACLNPACPEAPETLLSRADAALYRAKRAGRDRAEFDLKVVGA
jgi:diguanylate cyclase (GGDEF)-like protein